MAIPVYNEEGILVANARRVLRHLEQLGVDHQILIGSNGSNDGTVPLGRWLAGVYPCVEFFHLQERGVGLAFREFVRRARHQVLVSLDMDLSSDLTFIDSVLRLGAAHDIVIGSKKLAPQRRPLVRRLGSHVFLWCTRRLTGLTYDDYSIGAKAFRVEFLREMMTSIDAGSSYVLDLSYAATLEQRAIVCVPVACEDRRRSKFGLTREAVYKYRRLLALWRRARTTNRAPRQSYERHLYQAMDGR